MKKFIVLLYVLLVIAFPRFYRLGLDIANKDAFHFKNWSYVFMKEFEEGNYDKLYVTVQPGAMTIYSNIIGFKSLYFAKDKLHLIESQEKEFELLLHTYQKIPKAVLLSSLAFGIFIILNALYGTRFAVIFITLFSLEPFLLGQSRVIQTDALPTYAVFLCVMALILAVKKQKYILHTVLFTSFLLGISIIEKSSTLILILPFTVYIFLVSPRKDSLKHVIYFLLTLFITMVVLFPAFWGNFAFTLYRITIGSYLHGAIGVDAETFSLAPTHHIQSLFYYLRFLYNKLSELSIIGIALLAVAVVSRFVATKAGRLKILIDYKTLLTYGLAFVVPIVWFIIHELSVKKIDRYMLMVFPFLILLSTLGYTLVLQKVRFKHFYLVLIGMISLRLFQFTTLFPDLLLYKNPLSLDVNYKASETAWGSGRYKLGKYLSKNYGTDRSVYISDPDTLYLYYPGTVLNIDDFSCEKVVDLYITGSINKECLKSRLRLDSVLTIPGDITYFVYTTK